MMVFTMPFCKKFRRWLLLSGLVLLALFSSMVLADEGQALKIKNANFVVDNQHYSLLTEADIQFGPAVDAALKKGFKLHFVLEFQLVIPRKYWFNDEVVTMTKPIQVSYHSLSRQYLFSQAEKQQTFSSLAGVQEAFANLAPEPVFSQSILQKDQQYHAVVLLRLEYKKLPKDLQDEVDVLADWRLTSQTYKWAPLFF